MEIFYELGRFYEKFKKLLKLSEPVLWTLPITMFIFGYISTNQVHCIYYNWDFSNAIAMPTKSLK